MNHGIEDRQENLGVDEQSWSFYVVGRQRTSHDVFAWRDHGFLAEAKLQAPETESQPVLQTLEERLQEELQFLEATSLVMLQMTSQEMLTAWVDPAFS